MNLLFHTILISIVPLAWTATGGNVYFDNPKYPGKCVVGNDIILSPGDSIKDPNHECSEILCREPGVTQFTFCAVVSPPLGFQFGDFVNLALPFPKCCKRKLIKNRI